ncbi:hypothetical protein [Streptomyces sp. NPDC051546]|uniref:hypothetical protein n=1 Tax=Streptomyces sp. NPDC051546 TaxID=3365655 RepID=UPI0037AC80CB
MTEPLFTIQTLRAMHRGSANSLHVAFVLAGEIHTGPVVGIGSRLAVKVDGRLVEDIHPHHVIRAEVR